MGGKSFRAIAGSQTASDLIQIFLVKFIDLLPVGILVTAAPFFFRGVFCSQLGLTQSGPEMMLRMSAFVLPIMVVYAALGTLCEIALRHENREGNRTIGR